MKHAITLIAINFSDTHLRVKVLIELVNLINYVKEIRGKLEKYGDWLNNFDRRLHNGFNSVYNALTLTLELLNHYLRQWCPEFMIPMLLTGRSGALKGEKAERIIEITKWAFIHSMSIIEFSVKNSLKQVNPDILNSIIKKKKKHGRKGKRVRIYLRDIVGELKNRGCITDEAYKIWEALIEVRNAVVHNNAIADEDRAFQVGDIGIRFEKGRMLRGPLNFFTKLIEYAIENYKSILEILRKCRSP